MAHSENQTPDSRSPSSAISHSPSCEVSAARLPKPMRIAEQVWPEGTVPVVSVFCITYNQEKFIRDAIEGFLMQETTFPVEIFVHDDASTDGTAEIVKGYAEKYPKLFWPVLQTENQWSKGNRKIFCDYLAKQRGEFISICEGDDYWISADKLERQVALIVSDKKLIGAFHVCDQQEPTGKSIGLLPRREANRSLARLAFEHTCASYCFHTSSMIIQTEVLRALPDWLYRHKCVDRAIQILASRQGGWGFVNEVMSVRRIYPDSTFYHFKRDLNAPFYKQALGLDLSRHEHHHLSKALALAYFASATRWKTQRHWWRARVFFGRAVRVSLVGLCEKYGVLGVLKQALAIRFSLQNGRSCGGATK